ncbi:hypothetical protein [Burkholderia anthina]|uniref:hypothetical protein n=1 Tax=Burkholderia anthina TaxID=179879 RepID=UPI00158B249E
MKTSDNFASLLLPAFMVEIVAVVAAVVWNHNTIHPGGWRDLAVGLDDIFILGGAILYSIFWAIGAFIRLKGYKNLPASDERARNQSAVGLMLHCVGVFALFIGAGCLVF